MQRRTITIAVALFAFITATALVPLLRPSAQPLLAARLDAPADATLTSSAITYQGSLQVGGNPAEGQYDFIFRLYDAATGGLQVGGAVALPGQAVSHGLFTASLDFGPGAFDGAQRWLEIAVAPADSGNYTTLAPRQPLTPAPYALSLRPGAVVRGSSGTTLILGNSSNDAAAITASSGGYGGVFTATLGVGVYASSSFNNAIEGHAGNDASAVAGYNSGNGYGLYGVGVSNDGVHGASQTSQGVSGVSNSGIGAYGTSDSGYGVYGVSSKAIGVRGSTASAFAAVLGSNYGSGPGVSGSGGYGGVFTGTTAAGVYAVSGSGGSVAAVQGNNTASGRGVAGISASGIGVYGETLSSSAGSYAGYFKGQVRVVGSFYASDKHFIIDDPLDPANSYLVHTSVEGPERTTFYNGTIVLDGTGTASVTLPDYFEALNSNFRYQLTAIGAPMPGLYVAQEVKGNSFRIAGGVPNGKVSWQVTGVRNDAWAQGNPVQVELPKSPDERGTYLYPQGFGAGAPTK